MEVNAIYKYAPVAAQKARLVADLVRGKSAGNATQILRFCNKKAATLVKRTLDSAIANAEHNNGADIDDLVVATIEINEGPMLKRFQARARGRGNRILKRSCHIKITVSDLAGD